MKIDNTQILKKHQLLWLSILLAAGFLVRLLVSPYFTHTNDMGLWRFWAQEISRIGFPGFFEKVTWTDYLPFYFYILYGIEQIRTTFSIPSDLLFKMPSILSDIATAFLIFLLTKQFSIPTRFLLTGAYLFNPAIFANSAMWGQVDGIGGFLIILALYLFTRHNLIGLGVVTAMGVLFKPLYLIMIPLFMIAQAKKDHFHLPFRITPELIKHQIIYIVSTIFFTLLLTAPFAQKITDTPWVVIERYGASLGQYHYASVNAFNFWAMVGQNWKTDEALFLGISYHLWGLIIFISFYAVISLRLLFLKKFDLYWLIFSFTLAFLSIYTFATRVHERHLFTTFPFLVLLVASGWIFLYSYIILSVIYLLNLYFGIYYLRLNGVFIFGDEKVSIFSAAVVGICLLLLGYYLKQNVKKTT